MNHVTAQDIASVAQKVIQDNHHNHDADYGATEGELIGAAVMKLLTAASSTPLADTRGLAQLLADHWKVSVYGEDANSEPEPIVIRDLNMAEAIVESEWLKEHDREVVARAIREADAKRLHPSSGARRG